MTDDADTDDDDFDAVSLEPAMQLLGHAAIMVAARLREMAEAGNRPEGTVYLGDRRLLPLSMRTNPDPATVHVLADLVESLGDRIGHGDGWAIDGDETLGTMLACSIAHQEAIDLAVEGIDYFDMMDLEEPDWPVEVWRRAFESIRDHWCDDRDVDFVYYAPEVDGLVPAVTIKALLAPFTFGL